MALSAVVFVGCGTDTAADGQPEVEVSVFDDTSASTSVDTTSPTTAPTTSPTTPTTSTTAATATVTIDCPTAFPLGARTECDIISAGPAVSGDWEIPGFFDGSVALEVVPGVNQIYIEPTNPTVIGNSYTLMVTVVADDGTTVSASFPFTVTGP